MTVAPLVRDRRIAALDGLRAVAIARVVVWHVTGWAASTWFVSSVPAMFVVTGALLARSFASRPPAEVLIDRMKRLLPPMWLYCGFVLVLSHLEGARTSSVWTFVLPLVQPESGLGGGWFTSALWYLQVYLWVLIVSPVLHRATRRWGRRTVAVGVALVIAQSLIGGDGGLGGWQAGQVLLHVTCAVAGMTWLTDGLPTPRRLTVVAAGCAAAAGAWLLVRTPDGWVVNNDHVLHLFVGGSWAAALLALPALLTRVASSRVAQFLNRWPLTVYLWHSCAAWTLWNIVPGRITGVWRAVCVLVLTFAALPIITVTAGLAERRRPGWTSPGRLVRPVVALALVVGVLAVPRVNSRLDIAAAPGDQPLPPSAAPVVTEVEVSNAVSDLVDRIQSMDWSARGTQMSKALERYDDDRAMGGTRAIVIAPDGRTWRGGTRGAKPWGEPSLIGSLTKTITTTLVMRAAETGALSLDSPIGDLGMGFRHGDAITLRHLLTHTSGLPAHDRSSGLNADGTTPREVVEWASRQRLRSAPGTQVRYSTAGFALVGVVLERATGETFETVVDDGIARPYGYDLAYFRGRYRSIGFSTGGVIMKMDDLADWIERYVRTRTVTVAPWDWDFRDTTGVGVHGYCPCDKGRFTALGHMGGRTFATVDADGYVVVIDSRGVVVLDNFRSTVTLAQELRLLAGGGTTTSRG